MRGLVVLLAFVAVGAFAGTDAMAGTVHIDAHGLYESRNGYSDGELIVTATGVPVIPTGVPFGTFCTEMTEFLSIGGTYTAVVNTATVKGSTSTSDPLSPQTAWLYYQYRTGGIVIDTGAKATDFQYAIWKLEDEDTQAPSAWLTIRWTPEAEAYYQSALGSTWTDIGPVRVLNLGTGGLNQDILALVPEPVTMLSAFLAIGGLGLYVRRRTRV